MARASHIYLLTIDGLPVGSWTVKHELHTYLRDHPTPGAKVIRMRDGVGPAYAGQPYYRYEVLDITFDFDDVLGKQLQGR